MWRHIRFHHQTIQFLKLFLKPDHRPCIIIKEIVKAYWVCHSATFANEMLVWHNLYAGWSTTTHSSIITAAVHHHFPEEGIVSWAATSFPASKPMQFLNVFEVYGSFCCKSKLDNFEGQHSTDCVVPSWWHVTFSHQICCVQDAMCGQWEWWNQGPRT